MRIYFRSSLFLYEVLRGSGSTPIIVFWRATVYTFHRPARQEILERLLREYAETELVEPKRKLSWETRQVDASASKGLGFYWVEISRGKQEKGKLTEPEKRVDIIHYPSYEKLYVRYGYSRFLKLSKKFGKYKRSRTVVGRTYFKFWRWITRYRKLASLWPKRKYIRGKKAFWRRQQKIRVGYDA